MASAAIPHKPHSEEKTFRLRCYVYHHKSTGMFVAECIDLDLMVKSRKANKAIRELQDAIAGYVKVAVESGLSEELIPRRSPFSHRLHYSFVRLAPRLSFLHEGRTFDCDQPAYTRCFA